MKNTAIEVPEVTNVFTFYHLYILKMINKNNYF